MSQINSEKFKSLLESGCNNLNNQFQRIDALNVFPVPDGDTGTNMSLTFSAGVKEALNCKENSVSAVAKSLSKGLLMGARGNSGVILSQIFRGIYQGLEGSEEIDVYDLAKALVKGSEVAYKAVMRPVEGTILTVIRESSSNTLAQIENYEDLTLVKLLETLVENAKISLENTPNLLPVLKEVGVVDSGGAGLVVVFEGMLEAAKGNIIKATNEQMQVDNSALNELESEEFGYCTEFIIKLDEHKGKAFTESKLRNSLAKIGESIVVVQDEEIVKVHVHTLTPGEALNLGQRYGEFLKLKIENMQEQHNNIMDEAKPKKKYGLISVCVGSGLEKMFKELRVDYIVSGGQTMNPSTEDFVAAIKEVNAEHVIILPNNSNIILAAKQAALVCEDVDVHVIETRSIPQGLSSCVMFNPDVDIDTNISEMNEQKDRVRSGAITYSIKDTVIDGLEIKENDTMGIIDKAIVASGQDKMEVIKATLDQISFEDAELMTMIYGEDSNEAEIEQITQYIEDNFDIELDVQEGNQPVYSYLFGVE